MLCRNSINFIITRLFQGMNSPCNSKPKRRPFLNNKTTPQTVINAGENNASLVAFLAVVLATITHLFLATRDTRKEVNQFHMSEQLQARIPHVFCRSSGTSKKQPFFLLLQILLLWPPHTTLTSYLSHGNKVSADCHSDP